METWNRVRGQSRSRALVNNLNFGRVKAASSPSCSRRGWQTWRRWWVAAEGKKELLSKPQSDHKPGRARWRKLRTPADQTTEPAYWTSCPPPSWHTKTQYDHNAERLTFFLFFFFLSEMCSCGQTVHTNWFVPAWKLHQDEHGNVDEEVKYC